MCVRHVEILRVLNRRNVRRDPVNDPGVKERICNTSPGDSILLLGHWGAGSRSEVNAGDCIALDRLAQIVELVGGEIRFHLLLALPHARLNGHDENSAMMYLAQVATEASRRGIVSSWLDVYWERWGIQEPFGKISDEAWAANPLASLLEERASKHQQDGRSIREDAMRYWLMVQTEGPAIAREFPQAIWWTYGAPRWEGSSLAPLYPPMPRVHLWSLWKGESKAPWFS